MKGCPSDSLFLLCFPGDFFCQTLADVKFFANLYIVIKDNYPLQVPEKRSDSFYLQSLSFF